MANDIWTDSGARWICQAGADDATNLYLDFVRYFDAPAGKPLRLDITAVSQYVVSINGAVLGRGPAVSYQRLHYYDTWTVEPERIGHNNLIAVRLFHDGRGTETVQGFDYGLPGLLVHLYGDGFRLVSDGNWRVRRSRAYSPQASLVSRWGTYKEYYYGEREDDWRSAHFDHTGWERVVEKAPAVSQDYAERLVPLDFPRLDETVSSPARVIDLAPNLGGISVETRGDTATPFTYDGEAIAVTPGEPGAASAVTFDFGAEMVGYPELRVEGGPCVVEVWYGESLDLWRLDALHLPGDGHWRAFQRRAFRYMRLVFIAMEGPVRLVQIRQHNAWFAYNTMTHLATSDERFNRMLEVSRNTLKANTSYHYEDCPFREQALWIMDMRIMALINAYLYGNHDLNAKCLRQAFALQRQDGALPSTGPKDSNMFHHDFLLHLVGALREHHDHTGDVSLVREFAPNLERLYSFLQTFKDSDGLLDTTLIDRGQPYLDWSGDIEKAGKTTILNALYALYLDDMSKLSRLCGNETAADCYEKEASSVRERVRKLLFWPEQGVYRDACRGGKLLDTVSQQANMAAICAGIAEPHEIPGIMKEVWDAQKYPRPFGPSFYLITLSALNRIGRHDAIEDILRCYWGGMLDRGAATWWEVFNPDTPAWVYPHPFLGNTATFEMDWIPSSACHGWSGIPGYAVPRYLLGVELSGVAAGRVTIAPGLPGLFAKADYRVPVLGRWLRLAFTGEDDRYDVRILEQPAKLEIVAGPGVNLVRQSG